MLMTQESRPVATARAGVGRYRWYVLGVLTVAQLCHAMDRSIIALVLEPLRKEFALTDTQLGLLAGLAYGLAFACAAIPFGLAVDRFERRKLLAAAVAVWSGFTALCGVANSFVALLFSRAAVGAAEAGATPTGLSLVGDYFHSSERSTAVGTWYMSAGLGALAAFLGGGYIVQHYGWRAAFLIAGIPGLIIALVVFFTVKEPARGGVEETLSLVDASSLGSRLRLIGSQPGLMHCMIGITLVAITLSSLASWLVSFFVRTHGLSVSQSGMVVAFSLGLLGSIGAFCGGLVVDRLNRRNGFDESLPAKAAAITSVATAILAVLAIMASSTTIAIVMLLLAGFLSTAYNGPANALFVTLAPLRVRGLSVSILQFACNLVGMGIGPLIVGTVSQAVGPHDGLRVGLVTILLFNFWGAAHFLLIARALVRGRLAAVQPC